MFRKEIVAYWIRACDDNDVSLCMGVDFGLGSNSSEKLSGIV